MSSAAGSAARRARRAMSAFSPLVDPEADVAAGRKGWSCRRNVGGAEADLVVLALVRCRTAVGEQDGAATTLEHQVILDGRGRKPKADVVLYEVRASLQIGRAHDR